MSRFAKDPAALRDVSRRAFLQIAASIAALPMLDRAAWALPAAARLADDPFTLGVASGDPTPTGVVLWTRLAPKPLQLDGGMTPEAVDVSWVVASDERLSKIVKQGVVRAGPDTGHAVHVEVEGLDADRWYFYGFRTRDHASPVGRTRTMPADDVMPASLTFAFASCQHFEHGYYNAYRGMAADTPDMVFFLGDYIYEYAGEKKKTDSKDARVRIHEGPKLKSIADYRRRYAQYRSDAALTSMHASCPWWVTWDDHEFENNYANLVSSLKDVDPKAFVVQRAAAYRAYYEHMPLRPSSIPNGPDMQLFRKGRFGRLMDFHVLDTRQYRTDQVNGDGQRLLDDDAYSPENTILGRRQREWLESALGTSKGTWNLLAQQVMMGAVGRRSKTPGANTYSMDQWPGYMDERNKLLRFLGEKKVANPVVITGDIHSNWVNNLRVGDREGKGPIVGTEFVGTSISSGGNGTEVPKALEDLLSDNPSLKWHSAERGYVRCVVTPKSWRTDYVAAPDVLTQGAGVVTRKSFEVAAGSPGV